MCQLTSFQWKSQYSSCYFYVYFNNNFAASLNSTQIPISTNVFHKISRELLSRWIVIKICITPKRIDTKTLKSGIRPRTSADPAVGLKTFACRTRIADLGNDLCIPDLRNSLWHKPLLNPIHHTTDTVPSGQPSQLNTIKSWKACGTIEFYMIPSAPPDPTQYTQHLSRINQDSAGVSSYGLLWIRRSWKIGRRPDSCETLHGSHRMTAVFQWLSHALYY